MTPCFRFCAVRSLVALMAIPLLVHGGEATAVRSSAGALRVSEALPFRRAARSKGLLKERLLVANPFRGISRTIEGHGRPAFSRGILNPH